MTQLHWNKCNHGLDWCPFDRVSLDYVDAFGVYVIWKPGNPPITVRIGQGDIAGRIKDHRQGTDTAFYGDDLLVTWATVPDHQVDGVERYLAQQLSPAEGERFPNTSGIVVNLPW